MQKNEQLRRATDKPTQEVAVPENKESTQPVRKVVAKLALSAADVHLLVAASQSFSNACMVLGTRGHEKKAFRLSVLSKKLDQVWGYLEEADETEQVELSVEFVAPQASQSEGDSQDNNEKED